MSSNMMLVSKEIIARNRKKPLAKLAKSPIKPNAKVKNGKILFISSLNFFGRCGNLIKNLSSDPIKKATFWFAKVLSKRPAVRNIKSV